MTRYEPNLLNQSPPCPIYGSCECLKTYIFTQSCDSTYEPIYSLIVTKPRAGDWFQIDNTGLVSIAI